MLELAREHRRFTPEEYLLVEERAESRSEYIDGEIFSMPANSLKHNLILGNFHIAVRRGLVRGTCQAYASDVRLHVAQSALFTYPDLMVICGEPKLLAGRDDTILDACIIAEVFSPATEAYDRGEKFHFYQALPSLREYVLVSETEMRVDHYRRIDDGDWALNEVCGPDWEFLVDGIEGRIKMADIYEDILAQPTSPSP